jgi:transcriptional regulator with XRE-family HTH domain
LEAKMSLASLPDNLKRLRAIRRLTQAETAARASLSRVNYNRVERGALIPSLQTLDRIAVVLGTTPAKLLA